MAWSDDEIESLFNMNSVEFLPKQLLEVKNNRIYSAATVTPTALFDAQRIGNAAKGLVRLGTWLSLFYSTRWEHNRCQVVSSQRNDQSFEL